MARGIDYRDRGDVMEAYNFVADTKPNWAIFAGSEPVVQYAGGDQAEGSARLDQYLAMIEKQPTKQVFTLRAYDAATTNITNKTAYSGSTTFMLNEDAGVTTDPRTGLMILDRGSSRQPANNNNDVLIGRLDRLEAQNEQLRNQLHSQQIKALEDKLDAAISGITDAQKAEHWSDKLLQNVSDKPEIVPDMIGKIYDIFTGKQKNYLHPNPVAGTNVAEPEPTVKPKKKDEMSDTPNVYEAELTEAEVTALQDRQSDALDKLEESIGIEVITAYLERLANKSETDLEQWAHQEGAMEILRARMLPETLTKLVTTVAGQDDKGLNKLLNYLD